MTLPGDGAESAGWKRAGKAEERRAGDKSPGMAAEALIPRATLRLLSPETFREFVGKEKEFLGEKKFLPRL